MATEARILIAEDDPDDRMLVQEAWDEADCPQRLHFVSDGEELLAYLRQQRATGGTEALPGADLVLLDLNMPRMDGREALREIRADADLRAIPVVIFSTSNALSDISRSYELGANAFVSKPTSFKQLVATLRAISHHWFEVATLPTGDPRA